MDGDALTVKRHVCPVCAEPAREVLLSVRHNSTDFIDFVRFEPYWSKEFYDAFDNCLANAMTYEIAECRNCRMHYLVEVLNECGMRLLYNEWLDQDMLKAHYDGRPVNRSYDVLLGIIRRHFSNRSQPTLLDFGAGYGGLTTISQKNDFKTYAFDLSDDKNHSFALAGISIVDDLRQFPNYFDFIWVNQVLEHLANPSEVLKTLKASLAKGGFMYLAVPDCAVLDGAFVRQGLSRELFQMLSPHQHINAFTGKTLRLLAEKQGLAPLGLFDYLGMYSIGLGVEEMKFLAKKIIRNSAASTGLLFKSEC